MRKLKVGFSKAKSKLAILSWIIRKIEGLPFSHVYVEFDSETLDRKIIYQASKTTVHFLSKKRFDDVAVTVESYEFIVTDEIYKKIMQYAIDNAGKPYGMLQLIGMGISRLSKHLFGWNIKNPFGDGSKSYVCAELTFDIINIFSGIKSQQDLDNLGLIEIQQKTKEAFEWQHLQENR